MSDNEGLIKQAETMGSQRRILLILQGVSYVGWIGSQGLTPIIGHAPLLKAVQIICWPVWLLSLLLTFWLMRRTAKNHQIAALLDDERTKGLVTTVFQTSYWVLLTAVAVTYAATYVTEVDIKAVAPVLLSLGVAVPSLTYAALYRG